MGRRLRKLLALSAAAMLAVFMLREPILLLLGIPGTLDDLVEWRDNYLPMLSAKHVMYMMIAANLTLFLYFCYEDRLIQMYLNRITHANPDRIKATPRFVKIRQSYAADERYLAPIAKIQHGSILLLKLCDKVAKGDAEAYYIASYLFKEINKVSRKYAGSSTSWPAIIKRNNNRIEDIHDSVRQRLS